jgi:hypothetical protein
MRKPFFGIDVTEDRKKESFNSDEYISKSADGTAAKRFEETSAELDGKIKYYQLPTLLKIIKCIGLLCALAIISAVMEEDLTLKIAYKNAPILMTVFLVGSVVGVFLFLYEIRERKKMMTDPSVTEAVNEAKKATTEIFDGLGVPTYAHESDILLFRYKVKNGKIKPVASGMMPTPYVNVWAKVFSENGYLSIANVEGRYDIPLEEITGIKTVDKKIQVTGWNKEIPINDETFKSYGVGWVSANRTVVFRGYGVLEFTHGGEDFGIYIPSYDLPTFEFLLGIKAKPADETEEQNTEACSDE